MADQGHANPGDQHRRALPAKVLLEKSIRAAAKARDADAAVLPGAN
jgi:hypothetical protein